MTFQKNETQISSDGASLHTHTRDIGGVDTNHVARNCKCTYWTECGLL